MNEERVAQKIHQFWNWFLDNEYRFKDVIDVNEVVDALDEQILEFGLFAWEIREGSNRPYRLTISPNNDKERLELSRRIVDQAPDHADWEFFYCKPPLDWDFRLEMYDSFMVKQPVDTAEWEFVLVQSPAKKADILLLPTAMTTFDEDDKLIAADLALTHILGEEDKINYLGAVKIVSAFPAEFQDTRAKITALRSHFQQAFKNG